MTKSLALGADAVFIISTDLVALGDNDPELEEGYQELGATAGPYEDWLKGQNLTSISTQDPENEKKLDPVLAGSHWPTI